MQKQHFYMLLSNSLIAIMLLSLSVLTFLDPVKSVVNQEAYKVYYNGNLNSKNVSLMMNVYWGNEYLDDILNVFDEYDIKTTFFVGGVWVNKFNEDFLKIVNKGHEIGNHGYFHKSQDSLNYQQNQDEILSTHKLVKSLCGINMSLFAPPGGAYGDETLQVAKNLGYSTVMWTRDTIDWRDQDANLIFDRAIKNLKGGDLVLMHPTKASVCALPLIIDFIKLQGFNIVTVSENIKDGA